jgi:hypothetical protein
MHKSTTFIRWSALHSFTALLLACNYFAFQVELFECEYEANHPAPTTQGTHALSGPTVTWESFDKQNAPQAFVVDAGLQIDCILILASTSILQSSSEPSFQLVRDKSPPHLFPNQSTTV